MEKERIEEIQKTTIALCDRKKSGHVIDINETIPWELTLFFSKYYTSDDFKKIILPDNGKEYPTFPYKVILKCSKCNELYETTVSKTHYLEILQSLNPNSKKHKQEGYREMCNECKVAEEVYKKEREKERLIEIEISKKKETEYFINSYLNPDREWNKEIPLWKKISYCRDITKEAEKYARQMPYYDFLKTPYWKAIASKVRQIHGYKCQLCGSSEKLNVHHPSTYDFRGSEIWHLNELTCLCEECHQKFHGVFPLQQG